MVAEHWKSAPDAHDVPAAQSYLRLLVGPERAARLARQLSKTVRIEHFAAKDLLRASGLALLTPDDPEVAVDIDKARRGEKLSPVLLVWGRPLLVADGYHRICASYHLGEKLEVPCRIVAPTEKR